MRNNKHTLLVSLAALILMGSVSAAHAQGTGIYIGASWGAYSINESNLDDNDDVVKAVLGYQFIQWFGIEGSWNDFGTVSNGSYNFSTDGKGLSAVLSMPVGQSSSLFAKGGIFWWDADSNLGSSLGASSGDDPFWGVGVKLGLNNNFAIRLEAERYDVSSTDLYAYTVGVEFKF